MIVKGKWKLDKIVYIHELDSVRKYENSHPAGVLMTPGVEAVFSEIIKHGNIVAITMNQLTDSQLIKEALADTVAYESLLKLFELGALRVSLYGAIRTPSQYIQNAIKKCQNINHDNFIFSNLPIKNNDLALLNKMYNALKYSDLALLRTMSEDLSLEEKEKERLISIYRFVNMILQTSVCETSNIPAKATNNSKDFLHFLDKVTCILKDYKFNNKEHAESITKALEVITELNNNISTKELNTSNYINVLSTKNTPNHLANEIINLCYNYTVKNSISNMPQYDDKEREFTCTLINHVNEYFISIDDKKEDFSFYLNNALQTLKKYQLNDSENESILKKAIELIENQNIYNIKQNRSNWYNKSAINNTPEHLANEIINISYNYTVEDSVSNVSKHYNNDETFIKDLINRINLYFINEDDKPENKFPTVTTSQWKTLVRFAVYSYDRRKTNTTLNKNTSNTYESNYIKERISWILYIMRKTVKSFITAAIYISLFIAIESLLSLIEEILAIPLKNPFITNSIIICIMGILGEIVSLILKNINKGNDIPDILQSLKEILTHMIDSIRVIGGKYDSYKLPWRIL